MSRHPVDDRRPNAGSVTLSRAAVAALLEVRLGQAYRACQPDRHRDRAANGRATFSGLHHLQHGGQSWGPDIAIALPVRGNHQESTSGGPWKGFDGQFRGAGHQGVTRAFRYEADTVEPLTAAFGATG